MSDLFVSVQCLFCQQFNLLVQLQTGWLYRVRFRCRSYVSEALHLFLCNKHCVNNLFVETVQKSFNKATGSSLRENCGYTLQFAPD